MMNLCFMMVMTEMTAVMNDYDPWDILHPLCQTQCTEYRFLLHALLPRRGRVSKVKKTTAVLMRAMTEKSEKWQNKESFIILVRHVFCAVIVL